jgi:hypothetical protein
MNHIDTSNINDPICEQPFTGPSLTFLQDSYKEAMAGIVPAIVGSEFSDSYQYIMKGILPLGSNQYSDGYVWAYGEIYYCVGKTSITAAHPLCFTITTTPDASADPLLFTDGISRNVHNVVQVVLSDDVSGGDFLLSDCLTINQGWLNHPIPASDITPSAGSLSGYTTGDLTLTYKYNLPNLEFSLLGKFQVVGGNHYLDINFSSLGLNYGPNIKDNHFLGMSQSNAGGTQLCTLDASTGNTAGHYFLRTTNVGYLFTDSLMYGNVAVNGLLKFF